MSSTTTPIPSSTVLSCLCHRLTLPAAPHTKYAQLPIPCELCHCNTCRHQSGSLAAMLFELSTPVPQSLLTDCTAYTTSAKVTRFFCRVCGSNIFLRGNGVNAETGAESETWLASAGAVLRDGDKEEEATRTLDSTKVAIQVFVGDPVDGGLFRRIVEVMKGQGKLDGLERGDRGAGILRNVFAGLWTEEKLMVGEILDLVEGVKVRNSQVEKEGLKEEKLLAKCHCGKIQFCVTKPDPKREYGEIMQPYLMREQTMWSARFCTCWSCRSATGLPLCAWTYVAPDHIFTVDGKAIDFGSIQGLSQLPGIVKYENEHSDEEVIRSFCGTCGATIFYENRQRSWVVNISVGILRSERGPMAEDFLVWDFGWVSCKEECQTKELLEAVEESAV